MPRGKREAAPSSQSDYTKYSLGGDFGEVEALESWGRWGYGENGASASGVWLGIARRGFSAALSAFVLFRLLFPFGCAGSFHLCLFPLHTPFPLFPFSSICIPNCFFNFPFSSIFYTTLLSLSFVAFSSTTCDLFFVSRSRGKTTLSPRMLSVPEPLLEEVVPLSATFPLTVFLSFFFVCLPSSFCPSTPESSTPQPPDRLVTHRGSPMVHLRFAQHLHAPLFSSTTTREKLLRSALGVEGSRPLGRSGGRRRIQAPYPMRPTRRHAVEQAMSKRPSLPRPCNFPAPGLSPTMILAHNWPWRLSVSGKAKWDAVDSRKIGMKEVDEVEEVRRGK